PGPGPGARVDLGCPGWGVQGTAGQRAGAASAPLCPVPPLPGAVPALSAQPCSWCPILSYPEHTVDTMTPTPSSTTQNTGPAAEETDTQFAHKFEPPPGFVTTAVPAVDVLVPDAFSRWDPGQQRGYLAQRAINAAEGGTVLYTYACVRRATEHNQQPDPLDTAATMVGASMALSRRDAFRLVTTAVELIERLPRTSA